MFKVPDLPYDYKALEPFIDEETMHLHHDKHHQGYVDNLNKSLEAHPEFLEKSIEDLLINIDKVPESARGAVINNGGGHANHSFFWESMCPSSESGQPEGELKTALEKTFGSVEKFKEEFSAKAMSVFGSGWAWLVKNKNGGLQLKRQSFQNSPLMKNMTPILGIDVWEHAYYLKYKNVRKDYVESWWNVVNWKKVSDNFTKSS